VKPQSFLPRETLGNRNFGDPATRQPLRHQGSIVRVPGIAELTHLGFASYPPIKKLAKTLDD
jgi:hypothetical protein